MILKSDIAVLDAAWRWQLLYQAKWKTKDLHPVPVFILYNWLEKKAEYVQCALGRLEAYGLMQHESRKALQVSFYFWPFPGIYWLPGGRLLNLKHSRIRDHVPHPNAILPVSDHVVLQSRILRSRDTKTFYLTRPAESSGSVDIGMCVISTGAHLYSIMPAGYAYLRDVRREAATTAREIVQNEAIKSQQKFAPWGFSEDYRSLRNYKPFTKGQAIVLRMLDQARMKKESVKLKTINEAIGGRPIDARLRDLFRSRQEFWDAGYIIELGDSVRLRDPD